MSFHFGNKKLPLHVIFKQSFSVNVGTHEILKGRLSKQKKNSQEWGTLSCIKRLDVYNLPSLTSHVSPVYQSPHWHDTGGPTLHVAPFLQ